MLGKWAFAGAMLASVLGLAGLAQAQIYRYEPPRRPVEPTALEKCPNPPAAATEAKPRAVLEDTGVRFDPARPPVLDYDSTKPSPLQMTVTVKNSRKQRAKSWVEYSVCRLGTDQCAYGGAGFEDRRGRKGIRQRRSDTVEMVTKAALDPGAYRVTLYILDPPEKRIDQYDAGIIRIGSPKIDIVDAIRPPGSSLQPVEDTPPKPVELGAIVRNLGTAPGPVRLALSAGAREGLPCGLELYTDATPVPPGGAPTELKVRWENPLRGAIVVSLLVYDAEGKEIARRQGVRVFIP